MTDGIQGHGMVVGALVLGLINGQRQGASTDYSAAAFGCNKRDRWPQAYLESSVSLRGLPATSSKANSVTGMARVVKSGTAQAL